MQSDSAQGGSERGLADWAGVMDLAEPVAAMADELGAESTSIRRQVGEPASVEQERSAVSLCTDAQDLSEDQEMITGIDQPHLLALKDRQCTGTCRRTGAHLLQRYARQPVHTLRRKLRAVRLMLA